MADLHATPQFVVQTGPGIEWIGGEEEAVLRLGCLHEWVVYDGWTVSPQIHYDWTSGEDTLIVGIAVGRGF